MRAAKMDRVATAILLCLAIAGTACATEQSVLFVNVYDFYYRDEVQEIYTSLTNAGAHATYVQLDAEGEVAALLSSNHYDQVWVADISFREEDANYADDWNAIAAWYQSRTNVAIICDGRFLHSYANGRAPTEGQRLSENYYQNLKSRGSGILLATDDNRYHTGTNSINTAIGLNPFVGYFELTLISGRYK